MVNDFRGLSRANLPFFPPSPTQLAIIYAGFDCPPTSRCLFTFVGFAFVVVTRAGACHIAVDGDVNVNAAAIETVNVCWQTRAEHSCILALVPSDSHSHIWRQNQKAKSLKSPNQKPSKHQTTLNVAHAHTRAQRNRKRKAVKVTVINVNPLQHLKLLYNREWKLENRASGHKNKNPPNLQLLRTIRHVVAAQPAD